MYFSFVNLLCLTTTTHWDTRPSIFISFYCFRLSEWFFCNKF